MKYGFLAPQATLSETLETARLLESHGWDGFFTFDGISNGPMPTWDPWVVLGAVATQTERVTLGTLVHPLSRRRPWKVAREALTVDHLSNGRLVLPVGLGTMEDRGFTHVHPEITDRKQRAERLDEALDILKLAWQGEPFSYAGTHYRVDDLVFQPRPVNGDIPVWVVGAWPSRRSVGRAVRYEGIIPELIGRDLTESPIDLDDMRKVTTWVRNHRTGTEPFDQVTWGVTANGDSDVARTQVEACADAGATWWIESMWDDDGIPFDHLKRRIEQGPPRV